MKKETIIIKIEYDKDEGRIIVGDLIIAKIYSTKDGLFIGTIDKTNKGFEERVKGVKDDTPSSPDADL